MRQQATEQETFRSLYERSPELAPDHRVMERVSDQMSQRMKALRSDENEDLLEPHFRMLSWVFGMVAIGIYVEWPTLSPFFTEYPSILLAAMCLGGMACLAPLILLSILRGDGTDSTPMQIPRGGHTSC